MKRKWLSDAEEDADRKGRVRNNIRQLVWNTYVGAQRGEAYCYCCGSTRISPFHFECGHVVARARGGLDSVENLRPICGLCNRSMGTSDLHEFQRMHNLPVKRAVRGYGCACLVLLMLVNVCILAYSGRGWVLPLLPKNGQEFLTHFSGFKWI